MKIIMREEIDTSRSTELRRIDLDRRLNVLHLMLALTETSMPYNEHCRAFAKKWNIAICTYFHSNIRPPAEIEVFQGNNSLGGFFLALRRALEAREHDIIHAHAPHMAILLLLAAANDGIYSRLVPSTVFTAHNSYQNFKFRNRLMLLPAFACFSRIVCCSQAGYESFPSVYKMVAGNRLRAIPNGVDLDRIDKLLGETWRPIHKDVVTVLSVGRLIPRKNPLTVLRAFQRIADRSSRLVFVGQGPLRDLIHLEIAKTGYHAKIELTGLVPRDEVYRKFAHADLFVSASHGEGLPVAALEAMACRCPVILSDILPHREIAADVDFIPLVAPDDVEGFARAITEFRSLSVAQRKAVGEKCRALVKERFSLQSMHESYWNVYRELLPMNRIREKPLMH